MCPEALEDVPVEGVVVLERKSLKELEEGQREDERSPGSLTLKLDTGRTWCTRKNLESYREKDRIVFIKQKMLLFKIIEGIRG